MIQIGFSEPLALLLLAFIPTLLLLNKSVIKTYKILFLLRGLAVILVIFALSQIFIYEPNKKGNFVILIDKSSSMNIEDDEYSRSYMENEAYKEIYDNLNNQDEVTLIFFSDQVDIVKLKGSKSDIKNININESYGGSTELHNAIKKAISISNKDYAIFMITDGHNNGLIDPENAIENSNSPSIYCIGLGDEEVYDLGISDINIPQKSVVVGDIFNVQVEITNHGDANVIPITLDTGLETKNQSILIGSESTKEVIFNVSAGDEGGLLNMKISIPVYPHDILSINNEINFSIYVKDKLYLLYVDKGMGRGNFLHTGRLNESDIVITETIDASNFEESVINGSIVLTDYDALFLNAKTNLSAYMAYRSIDEMGGDWPNIDQIEQGLIKREYTIFNGSQLPENNTWDKYQFMALMLSDLNSTKQKDQIKNWIADGGTLAIGVQSGLGNSSFTPKNNQSSAEGWEDYPNYDNITTEDFENNRIQPNITILLSELGIYDYENIDTTETIVDIEDNISAYFEEFYTTFEIPWTDETKEIRPFPNPNIDSHQNLSFSTIFKNYSSNWTPVFTYYSNLSKPYLNSTLNPPYQESLFNGPKWTGDNAKLIDGKPVAMVRKYGEGNVYVFGFSQENYAKYGVPEGIFAPIWAIGARYSFENDLIDELKNYVQDGGGLIYIGSSPDQEMSSLLPAENTQGVAKLEEYYSNISLNHTIIDNVVFNFSLKTYEIIEPKLLSNVVAIISNQSDPLVMTWQYGIGRTIQFASDPTSSWAATGASNSMLNWTFYRQFWEQCTKWVSRYAVNTRILKIETEKNFYEIGDTIKVDIVGTNETVKVQIAAPVSTQIEDRIFEIDPTSSKKSSFYVIPDVAGEYTITATRTENKSSEVIYLSVTVLDTIEEYSYPRSDFTLLENIANSTEGEVIYSNDIEEIEDIMDKKRYNIKSSKFELWPYLLIISMGLFFAELGFRWRYI